MEEEKAGTTSSGYHVLQDGVAWGFASEGGPLIEGKLDFEEIVEAGPQAILLFGMLAQLGAYQRELAEQSDAVVAAAHALIEVAKAIKAQPAIGQNPDEIFARAETLVDRMMSRAMNRAGSVRIGGR
jgi:hypothetical protein